MSFENKGSEPPTVVVSLHPDRSGNYVCDAAEAHDVTIQRAIDYAGGFEGKVFIREGFYSITTPLDISGYYALTIEGANRGRGIQYAGGGFVQEGTVLALADGIDDHIIQMIEALEAKACGNKLINLNFWGNSENQTPAAAGDLVYLENVKEFTIESCTFSRAIRHAIGCYGHIENVWIVRNRISQTGDGQHCIYLSGVNNQVFENVIGGATDTDMAGIYLFSGANANQISDNTISNCYFNIIMRNAANNIISDNKLSAANNINLYVEDRAMNNLIANNIIETADTDGIQIKNFGANISYENLIIGNIISDNGRDGIRLIDDTEDTVIIGNEIINSGGYGINITEDVVIRTRIKENYFDNNTTAHLNDGGTDTITHEALREVIDPDSNVGDHPALVLPDAADTTFRFQVPIPLEFQQIVTAQVIVLQTSTGGPPDMQWSTTTDWGKLCAGENYNAGSDAETDQTTAVAQNNLVCIDVSASLTGIAAGDLVGFTFIRRGTQGGDTINADAYYLGFRLRYI